MNIKQLESKKAYIGHKNGINIGISYNTPIIYNTGVYSLVSENFYSVTTSHHKGRILRELNGQEIEVQQEVINNCCKSLIEEDYEKAYNLYLATINEHQIKQRVLKRLENPGAATIQDTEALYNNRKFLKETTKKYKNGNFQKVRYYKTNFKYVSNFHYKETIHAFKKTLTKNSREYTYHDYKARITINKE